MKTKKTIVKWEASETHLHHRGPVWKIIASLSLIAIIALGIYFQAKTFSLAILAFAVAHFVINRKPQRKITTEISELGITINKKFYPFSVIKKFWIICEPPHVNTLHLHIKGQLLGEIKLELENQNPETVRRALTGKVVELPNQHESVSEILLRILKI